MVWHIWQYIQYGIWGFTIRRSIFKKPVANGILTCENQKQARKRADPQKIDKGGNAADAAISLLRIIKWTTRKFYKTRE